MPTVYTESTSGITTNDIWPVWNQVYTITAGTSATTIGSTSTDSTLSTNAATNIWPAWNNIYTVGTTDSTTLVPSTTRLITTDTTTTIIDYAWGAWNRIRADQILVPPRISEEERQRRQESEQRYRQQLEEERKRHAEAEEKAERLLLSLLSEQQREEYQRSGRFQVEVAGKKFRVNKAWAGNLEELDDQGKKIRQYCVHPRERVPMADHMVAQKLFLEHNHQELLRIANRWN